jgi:hypothetical protein
MKYTWEEQDLKCGMYICKDEEKSLSNNVGWFAKWTHKIGFHHFQDDTYSTNLCIVAMTDGMVSTFKSNEDLVAYLNKQEMIPMPHKWLITLQKEMRNWYTPI